MLDRLELGDRFAELFPLLDVADRRVERPARETEHLRADADPSLVHRLDRNLVTLARLAEQGGAQHAAVIEQQLARAARANSQLVLFLADGEARRSALDDE